MRPNTLLRIVLLAVLTAITGFAWYGYQHDQLLVWFASIPFCG
jgi:hypothetical protein